MPEVSRFYGIVIKMFFKPKEHDPSHIHAIYGECVGVFDLASDRRGSSVDGAAFGKGMVGTT